MIAIVLGTRSEILKSKLVVRNMPSSKASVIIVTYNHRKYVEGCLSSVIANDPLEVIVDNGWNR